jgi:SAM-dependent methyltransferase
MDILDRQRAMWTEGDFPDMAKHIEQVAEVVVAAAGVAAGDDVLDVATGTGNAALIAARRGARVKGMDLTPKLLAVARERAAAEGADIEFTEGNAQELSYGDAEFDRVTSVFGSMFAPDHAATAGELLRVTRPGGTIAVAAWTPQGLNGQMFAVSAKHMPPPPPGLQPPVLWGLEDHARELFAGGEVRFERHTSPIDADSAEDWLQYCERVLGPIILARAALEPQGKWAAARADLLALYESANEATDGTYHAEAEYLVTVVSRAA